MIEYKNLQEIKKSIIESFNNIKLHHSNIFYSNNIINDCEYIYNILTNISNNHSKDNILIIKSLDKIIKISDINIIDNFIKYKINNYCKFILIYDLYLLNNYAISYLLKKIEEPENKLFYFFLTSNYRDLKDTIKSRSNILYIKNDLHCKDNFIKEIKEYNNIDKEILYKYFSHNLNDMNSFIDNNMLDNYQKLLQKEISLFTIIDLFKNKKIKFEDIINMIMIMMHHLYLLYIDIEFKPIFKGEIELLQELIKNYNQFEIFNLKDEIITIIEANNNNLNQTQIILLIFNKILKI